MKRPPVGNYILSILFFLGGMITVVEISVPLFYLFGWDRQKPIYQSQGLEWVVLGLGLGACVVIVGARAIIRRNLVAQMAFFGITLNLLFEFVSTPAVDSPFHSRGQIIVNRVLIVMPFVAACLYLAVGMASRRKEKN